MNIKKGKHRGHPSSSSRGASLFTEVLYDLLEDTGESGCKGVVSWSNDGLAFKVHNREMFMEHILPNYFLTKKYKSFARQLQLWGFAFCKKSSNPKYGAYFHPFFVRGKSYLLPRIMRVKIKGEKKSNRVHSKRQRNETLSASTDGTSPTTMISLKQRPSQEERKAAAGAAALPPGTFLTTYDEKRDKQEEMLEETIVAAPGIISLHIIIPEPRPIEEMLLDRAIVFSPTFRS